MDYGLMLLFNAVPLGGEGGVDAFSLLGTAGPVVKAVLVLLLVMSLVSWIIIFSKFLMLSSASRDSTRFLNYYHASSNFGNLYTATRHIRGPVAELFRAAYTELVRIRRSKSQAAEAGEAATNPSVVPMELGVVEQVERVLKKTISSQSSKLESYLTFLATTGSTAPFIGLFGTVWGIMTSFMGLVTKPGVPTLQAVAPGIAEALIATAVGLATAIPAVVAYNYFISKVRTIEVDMESFSAEFLNIVGRYFANP